MKRQGLLIRAVVIIILASLLFASFRGRPYVQFLFSSKYILYALFSEAVKWIRKK